MGRYPLLICVNIIDWSKMDPYSGEWEWSQDPPNHCLSFE